METIQNEGTTISLKEEIGRLRSEIIQLTNFYDLERDPLSEDRPNRFVAGRIDEDRKRELVGAAQQGNVLKNATEPDGTGRVLSSEEQLIVQYAKLAESRVLLADYGAVVVLAKQLGTQDLLDDLVQEGLIAYRESMLRFDLQEPTRIITFCLNNVRWRIGNYVNETKSTIRIPARLRMHQQMVDSARAVLGTNATPEVIASGTKLTLNQVLYALAAPRMYEYGSPDDIYDQRITDISALGSVEAYVLSDVEKEALQEYIARLSEESRLLLSHHYGLFGAPFARSLSDLGRELGVSRETMRVRHAKALKELRVLMGIKNQE